MLRLDMKNGLLIAALLVSHPLAAQVFFYPVGPAPRSVSTSAEVTLNVPAHRVSFTVSISEKALTAAEAGAGHAEKMSSLVNALSEMGLADESLPASSYSISRDEDYDTGEVVGYEARSSITLEYDKPGELGSVVDKLLESGASQISGITFLAEDPDFARDEAIRQAFAAAKKEALALATLSDATLGKVLNVSTTDRGYRKISAGTIGSGRATGTFIPVPQVKISATVSARWELKSPVSEVK